MDGWIKLHRKFCEWRWYKNVNTKTLFIHLLLNANHKTMEFGIETVKRGQIVVGRNKLAADTGLSPREVRTSLSHLLATNEISTIKTTNRYSILSVVNYDIYQSDKKQNGQQIDQQATSKRPASDQQATTNKNDKNGKNDKNDKNIKKTLCPNSDELRLAELLLNLILNNKPDFKKPDVQKWAKDIDLMIRLDSRKPDRIEKVIRWSQQDSFWQSNILSVAKLRKQFDVLELRMSGQTKPIQSQTRPINQKAKKELERLRKEHKNVGN